MSAQPQELWQLAPMSAGDLPAVLDIESRAYKFPWTEGIFRDCLQAGYSAWVVHNPFSEIMGYALMSMAVGEAHILNLCVDPIYHQQGLGRFLLDHLTRIARGASCEILLLEVRRSNRAALALYDKAGFARVGERKAYYPAHKGAREDALLLSYPLR